jgi:Asp-tRNA(Asn)/Glu-tRNA(Gln) amidotransferase A subunit family amidase
MSKDVKGSVGMPIGVQIVGHKWEDEICLGVMKALDEQVKFNEYPQILL